MKLIQAFHNKIHLYKTSWGLREGKDKQEGRDFNSQPPDCGAVSLIFQLGCKCENKLNGFNWLSSQFK